VTGKINHSSIFFDFDGTLIDSISILFNVYLNYLKIFDIAGTRTEFDELNGPSLTEIVSILKERYNLKQSQTELMELYKTKISEQYIKDIKPFNDAKDTLNQLKSSGKNLYIVTSNEEKTVLNFINNEGWTGYFSGYVFGSEVQRAKPHSDIYLEAIKKFSIDTKDVVVVEDSINGIISAKGAGLFVIGVTNNTSKEELISVGADKTVNNLSEIPDIIIYRHN